MRSSPAVRLTMFGASVARRLPLDCSPGPAEATRNTPGAGKSGQLTAAGRHSLGGVPCASGYFCLPQDPAPGGRRGGLRVLDTQAECVSHRKSYLPVSKTNMIAVPDPSVTAASVFLTAPNSPAASPPPPQGMRNLCWLLDRVRGQSARASKSRNT